MGKQLLPIYDKLMVYEIMRRINAKCAKVMVYGYALDDDTTFFGSRVVNDLDAIKAWADALIANRYDAVLDDVQGKIYTGILRGIKLIAYSAPE